MPHVNLQAQKYLQSLARVRNTAKQAYFLIQITLVIKQHNFKNVNNYLNTDISYYLETYDGQSSNLYFKVVHF